MTLDWSAFSSLQDTLDQCSLHSRSPCYPPRCSLQLASPLPSQSARPAEGRGKQTSLPVVFGSLMWKWAAQSLKRDAASFRGLPGVYGQHTPPYSSPACFACLLLLLKAVNFSTVLSSSLVCQVWLQRKWAGRRRVGSAEWLPPGVLFLFSGSYWIPYSCESAQSVSEQLSPWYGEHCFTQTRQHHEAGW